jgi:hypothetical protein
MEALDRHRGKLGPQMVVGSVNVNDGGQAIVGPVSRTSPEATPAERVSRKSRQRKMKDE